MGGTAPRGETQHGHARLGKAGDALGGLGGAIGYLCQLVGIRHRGHGHVTHHHHTVLAILLLLADNEHGPTHTSDARSTLDDLQSRPKRVACGAQGTRNLSVGSVGLDDHAAEIKIVLGHKFTSLLNSHDLFLAEFGQFEGILFSLGIVERVDDGSFVDVFQSPSGCQCLDVGGITDEDEFCYVVG